MNKTEKHHPTCARTKPVYVLLLRPCSILYSQYGNESIWKKKKKATKLINSVLVVCIFSRLATVGKIQLDFHNFCWC